MTSAVITFGTTLKVGDGESSEAFTVIPELISADGQKATAETVNVTNTDSPNAAQEKIGQAIVDPGQITASFNYIPTNAVQLGLRTDMYAGTTRNFQLFMNNADADVLPFAAIVVGWEKTGGGRGTNWVLEVTLDVTGKSVEPT